MKQLLSFIYRVVYVEWGLNQLAVNNICLFDGALRHFQQYLSYIVAVSSIGGRNRRTERKPPTSRKSLTNFIT